MFHEFICRLAGARRLHAPRRTRSLVLGSGLILAGLVGSTPAPLCRGLGLGDGLARAAETTPSAVELMKAADRARGGVGGGLTWQIEVSSTEDNVTHDQSYEVKVKGDSALVACIAPPKRVGERVLQKGHTLWFFKNSLKKPVTVSSRQKLSGQASNGDIAFTNFSRDYTGVIDGSDEIDGTPAWRLELSAAADGVTYDRIRYWISKDKQLGLRADFLTRQGKVFKTARYEYGGELKVAGQKYPFLSRMTIVNPSFPEDVTVIRYSHPQVEAHSDALFELESFVRHP